jgi:hypothetical protein
VRERASSGDHDRPVVPERAPALVAIVGHAVSALKARERLTLPAPPA